MPRLSGSGAIVEWNRGADYPARFVRWTAKTNLEAFLHLLAAGRITASRWSAWPRPPTCSSSTRTGRWASS
jgi:hypothetical protein